MNIFRLPVTPTDPPRSRRTMPVVPPLPRPFDFGLSARTPLVPLSLVAMFLNRKPRTVMGLVESGELRWAFDIRSAAAASQEVRVFRDSLFEYVGLRSRECVHDSDEREFADIIKSMLPGPKPSRQPASVIQAAQPMVRAAEVAQCFSCSNGHVHNLVRDHLLRGANTRKPGANLEIQRASVVEFLWKRRVF